jgi:hypothetical protein
MRVKKLVTNCSSKYRCLASISMLAVIMGSWAGCAAPEASPTPLPLGSPMPTSTLPPLPTPTLIPTLPPLPTPTLTPALVPPVSVELEGKVDDAGILLEEVEVISGDGVATLHLAKGTKVLDAGDRALDSITVTARLPEAASYKWHLSDLAYDFSPGDTRFDPLARLTISYDPSLIIPEAEGYSALMGYFDEAESSWTWLEVTADIDVHCVTAEVDHLGTFIVAFEIWYELPVS